MMLAISIVLLFFTSLSIQASFLYSLSEPLSLLPIHFLLGVLVLHRLGPIYGMLWFAASWFFILTGSLDLGSAWAYLISGIVGVALIIRVFTNRSVYALEGLGLGLFLVFSLVNIIFGAPNAIATTMYGFIFLFFALYVGFLVTRYGEHLSQNVLFIRRGSN